MVVTCVHVYVKPEHIQDFIQASTANHLASVREPGNLRFDVLQAAQDPSRFLLYEAYATPAAAAAHKQTPHYLEWRDRVAAWMAKPRDGVAYTAVCPKA